MKRIVFLDGVHWREGGSVSELNKVCPACFMKARASTKFCPECGQRMIINKTQSDFDAALQKTWIERMKDEAAYSKIPSVEYQDGFRACWELFKGGR